jgi:prepilin-type N-terminal cleavage/methylation domain-containing protein
MKNGFSLVEILVAISVFGIFVVLFFSFFETNRNSYEKVITNNKAVHFAKEGIEAVRNIRDKNFADLSNGTWGLSTTTNKWQLDGVSNIDENFIREILISEIDPQTKKVESKVSYNLFGATSTFSLITHLTYWQEDFPNDICLNQADFLDVDVTGVYFAGSSRRVEGINVSNIATGCDVIIGSINISWNSPAGRRLTNIFLDGNIVWTGNNTTPVSADITDTIILRDSIQENTFEFSNTINGRTFTITYVMSDGTTKVVSGITP